MLGFIILKMAAVLAWIIGDGILRLENLESFVYNEGKVKYILA